ncbi:MAG: hypothetical protein H6Q52_3169, partial [Deltaproteobacteria bacterium]|nr:hypothetical protein [Deltaproteobacteria bacterium]
SVIDRSLYYKGLMLLIRKDREICDEERKMMMHIGEALGFESSFCKDTVEDIMDNKFVNDSPPLFSEPWIALSFIRDGLRLSVSDGQTHKAELDWLEAVAENNGLSSLWAEEFERFSLIECNESLEDNLELKRFEW